MAYCLIHFFSGGESSFIKPNNVPRVGRSNEEIGPFGQGSMGYVIKTNKNIPRMGRRNYDSVSVNRTKSVLLCICNNLYSFIIMQII